MIEAQEPGGLRTYRCGPPCGRSHVLARALEQMAEQTALNAIPSLPPASGRDGRLALFAEMFRRVVVHGDTGDVLFVGYAN